MRRGKQLTYTLGRPVVIVLGGGVFADDTPWPATRFRAEKAAELALLHKDATVICSGAGPGHKDARRKTEAEVMAEIIMQKGVEPRRLRCETQSIDTIGNAVLCSAKYLHGQKPRPTFVVTSPFHVQRAELAFDGVLGAKWPVAMAAGAPADDDAFRATTELGGVDWMRRFFTGVTPGDLPQIVKRLFEVGKPYYRTLPMLTKLAAKAA